MIYMRNRTTLSRMSSPISGCKAESEAHAVTWRGYGEVRPKRAYRNLKLDCHVADPTELWIFYMRIYESC